MKVEIWSDVACPWCLIGKRRFEAALERFAHSDDIDVEWKSFELDRTARSRHTDGSEADYADRLASKYGVSRTEAQEMLDSMTATGAAEGLDFRFDKAVKANTFDAHQLLHLAADCGIQGTVKERLLRAYFTEGEDIGDRSVLGRLGAEAGLDADEVRQVLDEQRYADAVRADESEASRLGVSAVPFFVVDRKYGIAGAQSADQILVVLRQSWSQTAHALTAVGAPADGTGTAADAACEQDCCAV